MTVYPWILLVSGRIQVNYAEINQSLRKLHELKINKRRGDADVRSNSRFRAIISIIFGAYWGVTLAIASAAAAAATDSLKKKRKKKLRAGFYKWRFFAGLKESPWLQKSIGR